MEYSPFLARWLGIYFVLVGLAVIWNKDRMPRIAQDLINSPCYLMESGAFALFFGIVLVMIHNVWVMNLSVLITIIGYLLILRGLVRLFFPEFVEDLVNKFIKTNYTVVIGAITIIIGALLLIYGYGIV